MHFDWRAGALEKVAGGSNPVAEGLLLGDNLPILERIPDGSIDLVYIDPPFGTGNVRRHERIRLVRATGLGQGLVDACTRS